MVSLLIDVGHAMSLSVISVDKKNSTNSFFLKRYCAGDPTKAHWRLDSSSIEYGKQNYYQ